MRYGRKTLLLVLGLVLLALPLAAQAKTEDPGYYPTTYPYNPYHKNDPNKPFDYTYPCPVCGGQATITVGQAPTCTEEGFVSYRCFATPECSTFRINIKKLAHDWHQYFWTDPTCGQVGTRYYYCSLCGGYKTEEIPALGHN